MKTKTEIEKKLQDLEADILNLREEINFGPIEATPAKWMELSILENQAVCLKWCLS